MNAEDINENLTDLERFVIEDKGTERPFSGIYVDHFKEGIYRCKRCNQPLFESASKFHSDCGWSSFDDAIPGKVEEKPDEDGIRTEIVCSNCGAHLGHVFLGENFTEKNVRHCVNSVALTFDEDSKKEEVAIYAGGCFWGVEYYLNKEDGVKSTTAGYSGGDWNDPAYKEVTTGRTGHAEAVKVVFDSDIISYEDLTKLFFEIHDPTQLNRQGPDIGNQYRSAIFYQDEKQRQTAEKLKKILEEKGLDVKTEILPAEKFYPAEEYHQDYYDEKGTKPYCHGYKKRF